MSDHSTPKTRFYEHRNHKTFIAECELRTNEGRDLLPFALERVDFLNDLARYREDEIDRLLRLLAKCNAALSEALKHQDRRKPTT